MKKSLLKFTLLFSLSLVFIGNVAIGQCTINDVGAEIVNCTDGEFDVVIDFEYQDVTNQFTITGNGVSYGTFEYSNLPITLSSLDADCTTSYEFVVTDEVEGNCSNFAEIGVVCCDTEECEIGNPEIVVSDCVGGEFTLTVDFDYANTSSTFQIRIYDDLNEEEYVESYPYTDLPIDVVISNTNSTGFYFEVEDNESADGECIGISEFFNPCYEENASCQMTTLDFGLSPVCENGSIVAEWLIDGENISEVGFDILVDGVFQFFIPYEDDNWYDFQFEAPDNELFTLTVCDNDNADCCISWELENPCYEEGGNEDCEIGDLVIETSECEEGSFTMNVNFDHANTTSTFQIRVYDDMNNAVYIESYSYTDLAIDITIENSTSTYFVIEVEDNDIEGCISVIEIENPCYEENASCQMTTLDFGLSPVCENGSIVAEWLIDGENISEVGFDILVDGVFQFFIPYEDDNWYDFQFEAPDNELFTLTVCDNDNADCCISWELENPCYEEGGNEDCEIGDLVIETSECEEGSFTMNVNFDHANTTSTFQIRVYDDMNNAVYIESYSYTDLAIDITIENNTSTYFVIEVEDNDIEGCISVTEIENPCYEEDGGTCEIYSIDFGPNPVCEDGIIVAEWYIFSENTSEVGFDILINNEFLLFVNYNGEGPYIFDIPAPETEFFTITACDNDNADCCYSWELENPCYENTGNCEIGNIETDILTCEDGLFDVLINFEHANTTNQFTIVGNGTNYGAFSYTDLPITLVGLEANCEVEYEFIVEDVIHEECSNFTVIGTVCCEEEDCEIGDLVIETSECEEGSFTMNVNFDHANTTSTFQVRVYDDMNNAVYIESYSYTDLAIDITIENNTSTYFVIEVEDNDIEGCISVTEIENPCYEENASCQMTTLDFGSSPVCENGSIVAEWLIDGENISEVGFDILVDGVFQFFIPYEDDNWYDFQFEAPDNQLYTLTVCDNDNADCCISWELENPCYEEGGNEDCEIGDLVIETSECEEGSFTMNVNFDHANTTSTFQIRVYDDMNNAVYIESYSYTDLAIDITIENNTSTYFVIEVEDNDIEGCISVTEIENPCYEEDGGTCEIYSIDFGPNPVCEDGIIVAEWYIFSENTSEVGFDILINNEFLLFVNYNGEGPYIFDIPAPETEFFTITACDNDNADCCYSWELENPCYENTGNCEIGNIETDILTCEDGLFDVLINFEHANTTNQFTIVGNGTNYGAFSYTDLPITLVGLEANCEVEYEFIVEDVIHEECSNFTVIGTVCCEEEDCEIGDLVIETSECEEGSFTMNVNFDHANTSSTFQIRVYDDLNNAVYIESYSYTDLAIDITIENSTSTYFVIEVEDNDIEGCVSVTELENPCYEENASCQMTTLDFGLSPVCENGSIVAEWLIDGENISEVGFDILVDGVFQFFIPYEDDSWYDFQFEAPDNELFTLTVCDNDNADCCISWELENPCYEEGGNEDCEIGDLVIETSECEEGSFTMNVNFDHANTTSTFQIRVYDDMNETVYVESYSYADLPINISIENNESPYFVVEVEDNDIEGCGSVTELGNPCYEEDGNEECNISELVAEVQTCADEIFDVIVDFEYENVSDSFELRGNGVVYGIFSYSDLPISLTELSADCTTEYEFVAIDSEDEECTSFFEIGSVCCPGFNNIDNLVGETIFEDDLFTTTFYIDSDLLPGCVFDVFIDGALFTTLEEDNSFFVLGPFECGSDEVIDIEIVNSCSNESTQFDYDLATVSCVTNTVDLSEVVDLDWNIFNNMLTIDFEGDLTLDVQVLSVDGRLLRSAQNISSGWNLDLSSTHSGLYFVRLVDSKSGAGMIKKIYKP